MEISSCLRNLRPYRLQTWKPKTTNCSTTQWHTRAIPRVSPRTRKMSCAIKMHHVGNHWVTSSSIGGIVSVYDSKFYRNLSNSLQCQLVTIYKLMITREEDGEVVDPHIAVRIPNIPQQQGVADCGVYAIAYAFHAARGDDLEEMTFDQATMREHLARCFSRQKLTPFPHLQKNAGILYPRYLYQHIEVFCNCEMPECLDNMIQCDGCEEYYMVPHELCWTRNPPSRN